MLFFLFFIIFCSYIIVAAPSSVSGALDRLTVAAWNYLTAYYVTVIVIEVHFLKRKIQLLLFYF